MKATRAGIRYASLPKDYAGLCRLRVPRPIHDRVDLDNAMEITDAMAGHDLTPDQADYFDLFCRLIEDYEREHLRVKAPKASGLEVLRHLLKEHEMTAADLSRLLGTHRTLGPMLLRGERQLTLAHVRTLSRHFGLPADTFITPTYGKSPGSNRRMRAELEDSRGANSWPGF